jgi:hypothetical protein
MPDQAFVQQGCKRLETLRNRFSVRNLHHSDAQIHEIEPFQFSRFEILLDQST